ncbi:MAG TPA: PASTA domain-containing protein [Gaiellaceae bacterium]|jgi:hypothetical protein
MTAASHRRFVAMGAIAVVVTAALLSGAGAGASAAAARATPEIPAGLAAAIHARFGAGAIRSSLAAPDTEGPLFGYSVAVSADGTTALVGAPAAAHEAGAAYVFHVSDAGSWASSDAPTAALTLPSHPVVVLGYAVALSTDGTTAFVAAPAAGSGSSDRPGVVYVFHVATEDAWTSSSTPTATLAAAGSVNLGIGGLALSADGTTLVAGAPFYNDPVGGAYVFHASSDAAWVTSSIPTAVLSAPSEASANCCVGSAVTISGDGTTALVSDFGNPDVDAADGGAFVYHVAAEDSWTSSASPAARLSDAHDGVDYLGAGLALSGDGTAAFLAGLGAVDVFHASDATEWASTSTPTATLFASPVGFVAGPVAVSTDGTTALVTGFEAKRAAAFVFRVSAEDAWASSSAPTATLINSAEHTSSFPGEYGVLSGDGATVLTGDPFLQANTGAADVFHAPDESSWVSSSTPTAILTDATLARCVVPKLRRLTVSAAKSRLEGLNCRLGKVRRVHAKAAKGRVVSQSPKSGARLAVGTKVDVKVAK